MGTPENENMSVSDIALPVDASLKAAGLLPPESKLPKLGKILDNGEQREIADAQQLEKRETKTEEVSIQSPITLATAQQTDS